MKLIFSLTFTFFSCLILHSQSKNVILSGQIIIDSTEYFDLEGIKIHNLNSDSIVYSNIFGSFNLHVQESDLIRVSAPSINNRLIKISSRIIEKKKLQIHLNEDVVELEEAVIKKFQTTGWLELDVKRSMAKVDSAMFVEDLVASWSSNPDYIRLQDIEIDSYWDHFPLTKNLESIPYTNIFDPHAKETEAYLKQEIRVNATIQYMGNDYFIEELQIPEEIIYDFVKYCYKEKRKLKEHFDSQNFIELIGLMEKCSPEFIKINRPDSN